MDRRHTGNMICLKFTLLFLLFVQVFSEEPEPVFRPVGSLVEMGYCFGVDYIVVYRVTQDGHQLLGNSSAASPVITPPSDLQGRISTSHDQKLLGLQIKNLNQSDSGTYIRECWMNQTLVNRNTQQLIVCDFEAEAEEIPLNKDDRRAEITCPNFDDRQEGVSVRWYHDIYPTYTIKQLLDSRVSLGPVDGVIDVRNSGALLVLNHSMLSNNQHFYCLVFQDTQCLSFQNLYVPENVEGRNIFASHGDRVVLYCEAEGDNQHWKTPTGKVENTDQRSHHMLISTGDQSEHFSLVIHSVSGEHFGDYACVSSLFEMQYTLVLCPKKQRLEMFVAEGGEVTLHCDISQVDSYMVLWYRREASGQPNLIYDSGDESVPTPEDLRGRMAVSEENSALTISHVVRQDEGVYSCVVLKSVAFIDDDDYTDEYADEEEEEESGPDWTEEDKCLFKQETFLSVNSKRQFIPNVSQDPPKTTPAPPKPRANACTTGASVGLTLLVIVLNAVIFV